MNMQEPETALGYDVPATLNDKTIKEAGKVTVVSGRTGSSLATMEGSIAKDGLGFAVAGGKDIDQDGFDDVVVGAPMADNTLTGLKNVGFVAVIFGPDGNRTPAIYGTEAKAMFGAALALGDINFDGQADIVIGIPKADNSAISKVDAGGVSVRRECHGAEAAVVRWAVPSRRPSHPAGEAC